MKIPPLEDGCGEEDIWFERTSHAGTQEFRRHVRLALEDFQGRDFSSIIFKSIVRELKGKKFFWGEGEIALEIKSDDVLYSHFEEAYQEEQERRSHCQEEKELIATPTKKAERTDESNKEPLLPPTPMTVTSVAADEDYEMTNKNHKEKKKLKKYFRCVCVVDVQSPIDDVKDVVFDLRDCEKWNPAVESVEEASNGALNGRKLSFYGGGYIDEEVVTETDSTIQFQVTTNKPSNLTAAGSEFRIEKMDEYTTRVTSTVLYRPKYILFAKCFSFSTMNDAFGAAAWQNAQGIKYYCETGETVTSETEFTSSPYFECDYN